jgi:hypothetical protein
MFTDVVISVYVDGSLEHAHGIAWWLDLIRRDSGWDVDRSICLHANDERDDVVEELPGVQLLDSRQLAEPLPVLVDEWLQMPISPIPHATARSD